MHNALPSDYLRAVLHESLADRAWLAYQCLPRDSLTGALPSYRTLANAYGFAPSDLTRLIAGDLQTPGYDKLAKVSAALQIHQQWLAEGLGRAPKFPRGGHVLPRPGSDWIPCYADADGWDESLKILLQRPEDLDVPPEAFAAGGDLPIYRYVPVTPPIAIAVALYAWETLTVAEQKRYSTQAARAADPGRANHLKTKAVK